MNVAPSRAFGKLQRDASGATSAWHPLVDHMIDVAACFDRLCACRSIRRAMEATAGRILSTRVLQRLTALVFLHDLGKASSGFQVKRFPRDRIPKSWPSPTGHGREALLLFDEETLSPMVDRLPVAALETWGEAVLPLLRASISHHGRPIAETVGDWNRVIWRPVIERHGACSYDPGPVLAEIGRTVVDLYPEAFAPGGEPLPETPRFTHLFAGLVQLADWLGSDTRFFPYSEPGECRAETARGHADDAIAALGLDAETERERLATRTPTFSQVFGNPAYPVQAAMADAEIGPLVILESETGSGKTEAALWRYAALFRAGLIDGLYFALPTRVSATQVCKRVQAAARSLWPETPPVVVRALPGYASADGQEPQALPHFQVLWPDEPGDAEAHRRWAAESPKRFLAAPLAVGTIDQALLGALQVRHAHLRHALLARSLLVVDEVHASDAYMRVLLEGLLEAHLACGGQALLLSATLGASARARFLGLGRRFSGATPPDFGTACAAPYPAISDNSGIRAMASTARPKVIAWQIEEAMDDPGRIASLAVEAAGRGAKVLVIRNTVPAAVATLQALETACPQPDWLFSVKDAITLHHSRFSRQDRPLLDEAIEARLGKDRPTGAAIVVGTQTLEQSLDLDADFLITDLCPMDVLLQRIGRLHRHDRGSEGRPLPYRQAQVRVLAPPGQDLSPMLNGQRHGLGPSKDGSGVYPDLRIVEATRLLIAERPQVAIPADNRYLVEAATHPERLAEIETKGGEPWRRLAQQVEGRCGAERAVGYIHRLDFTKEFGLEGFPDQVKIATRLGVEDRILRFEPGLSGPFGAPLRELPVRSFLVPRDLPAEAEPVVVSHDQGRTEFVLGSARFRYSRLGLERLKDD